MTKFSLFSPWNVPTGSPVGSAHTIIMEMLYCNNYIHVHKEWQNHQNKRSNVHKVLSHASILFMRISILVHIWRSLGQVVECVPLVSLVLPVHP